MGGYTALEDRGLLWVRCTFTYLASPSRAHPVLRELGRGVRGGRWGELQHQAAVAELKSHKSEVRVARKVEIGKKQWRPEDGATFSNDKRKHLTTWDSI